MMGLLDQLDDPVNAGLLSMGLRLMSTPGKFGQAFGQAGLGALGDVQQARQQQEQRKGREQQQQANALQMQIHQQQLADMQRQSALAQQQQQREQQFRDAIPSPSVPMGPPTLANAANMPKVDPYQAQLHQAMRLGLIKPMDYLASTRKDTAPMKVGKDDRIVDPQSLKVLLDAVPDPAKIPAAIQEYQYAQQQGYKGSLLDYTLAQKKAGANSVSVNVPVNTTKTLMQSMAEKLGGQIDDNFGAAKSAVSAIEGAQKVRNLLATGKIVTGPGADLRVNLRQVADALGVGGKDNSEVLANTRQTIQQLAQFELDAGAQMKGQGAVTESERAILRKAAAGDINFTSPELGALTQTIEGRARKRIASHRDNVQRLGKLPGGEVIAPLYQVNEPGAGSIDDLVNKWTR